MMRIALILLAFYTAMLSCVPCQDEAFSNDSPDVVSLIKGGADQRESADLDLCSPFCSCTCCASVSLQHYLPYLPAKASFSTFEEIGFAYLSSTHSGDLTSIWQPPRA